MIVSVPCQHTVITTSFDKTNNSAYVLCTGCDTILTPEKIKGRNYEFDITYDVWVWVERR